MDDQHNAETPNGTIPAPAGRFTSIAFGFGRGVAGFIVGGTVGYLLRYPALFMLWGGNWTPGTAQIAQALMYLLPIGGAIIGMAVGIKPRLLNCLKLHPDR